MSKVKIVTGILYLFQSVFCFSQETPERLMPEVGIPVEFSQFGIQEAHKIEGIETELPKEVIEDFRKFINLTLKSLTDLQNEVKKMNYLESNQEMRARLSQIETQSGSRKNDELTRFSLRRAEVIVGIFEQYSTPEEKAKSSYLFQMNRFLNETIEFGIRYNKENFSSEGKGKPKDISELARFEYAKYGLSYLLAMSKANELVINPEVQYHIYKFLLGLFRWDLYRDENKYNYRTTIIRVNDKLDALPKTFESLELNSRIAREIESILRANFKENSVGDRIALGTGKRFVYLTESGLVPETKFKPIEATLPGSKTIQRAWLDVETGFVWMYDSRCLLAKDDRPRSKEVTEERLRQALANGLAHVLDLETNYKVWINAGVGVAPKLFGYFDAQEDQLVYLVNDNVLYPEQVKELESRRLPALVVKIN
jgi:hypothetical protein